MSSDHVRLTLPDVDVLLTNLAQATLLKYVVTNSNRPPAYHLIRTTINADFTVQEDNPNLPYSWTGTWQIDWRLDMDWLVIKTGDYLNAICLFLLPGQTYKALEYYKNFPTGVEYDVLVVEYALKE